MNTTIDSTFGPASRPQRSGNVTTPRWNDHIPLGIPRLVETPTGLVEYFRAGAGRVVVLIPALAQSVAEFNDLAGALHAHGFQTIAIHHGGVGQSQPRAGKTTTLLTVADQIDAVLNHAGVPREEPVFLIGRALGNRIARAFGAGYPGRTAGVVLLGSGGAAKTKPPWPVLLKYLFLQVPGLSTGVRRRLLESLLCVQRNVLPDGFCRKPPLRAVLHQARSARRTPLQDWWSGGKAPMLVIQGESDRIAPQSNARVLKETFPERVELLLVPSAGHALTFDAPDVVRSACLDFLLRQTQA